jgi:hypothetical protein
VKHILVNCVLSMEVWFRILSLVGLKHCTPNPTDIVFQEWWSTTTHRVPKQYHPGFNSLVTLVAMEASQRLETSPSVQKIIQDVKEEARLWCLVDAKG